MNVFFFLMTQKLFLTQKPKQLHLVKLVKMIILWKGYGRTFKDMEELFSVGNTQVLIRHKQLDIVYCSVLRRLVSMKLSSLSHLAVNPCEICKSISSKFSSVQKVNQHNSQDTSYKGLSFIKLQ